MNNGGYPGGPTNFLTSLAAQSLHIKKRIMIVRNYPANHSKDNLRMKISDWVSNRSLDNMITVSKSLKNAIIDKTNIDIGIFNNFDFPIFNWESLLIKLNNHMSTSL